MAVADSAEQGVALNFPYDESCASTCQVIKTNYDWDKFFKPCINRNITFYNRPLQSRFTASSQLGGLPTGEYKTWGDAQEHYNGAGDLPIKDGAAPIQFFVKMPGSDVPDKLPPVDFATPALKKDVRKLAKQFCSQQERDRIEEMIENPGSLASFDYDGEEGQDGLPGRPADTSCVDRSGKVWKVDVRILDELPKKPWEIPANRAAKIRSMTHITEEERLRLPRIFLDNERSVPHPPWVGAKELSVREQLQQDLAFARSTQPWRQVATIFINVESEDELKEMKINEKAYVAWMREHKIAHTYLDAKDNKRKQLLKPAVIKAVWEHFQICSCNLEDSGAAGDAANRGRGEGKVGRGVVKDRLHKVAAEALQPIVGAAVAEARLHKIVAEALQPIVDAAGRGVARAGVDVVELFKHVTRKNLTQASSDESVDSQEVRRRVQQNYGKQLRQLEELSRRAERL
eukprot:g8754.t1